MKKSRLINQEAARARRDQMIASAEQGRLSLTEGVREMRTISGLTQEEFAQHRGIGTRVLKALELGQGNPTVATLNRVAELFGLEVAFVPSKGLHSDAPSVIREPHDADIPDLQSEPMARMKAALLDHQNAFQELAKSLQLTTEMAKYLARLHQGKQSVTEYSAGVDSKETGLKLEQQDKAPR